MDSNDITKFIKVMDSIVIHTDINDRIIPHDSGLDVIFTNVVTGDSYTVCVNEIDSLGFYAKITSLPDEGCNG